jgi:hypothetical protein
VQIFLRSVLLGLLFHWATAPYEKSPLSFSLFFFLFRCSVPCFLPLLLLPMLAVFLSRFLLSYSSRRLGSDKPFNSSHYNVASIDLRN